jgi:hypothetical protein
MARNTARSILAAGLVSRVTSLALTLASLGATPALAAGDPSDPLPQFDASMDEKHFRAVVDFRDRETASLPSVEVRFGIARGRIGNPPLLRLRVLDSRGSPLQEFNEWHPLWEFHWNEAAQESLLVKSSGEGELVFPFDPDAAVLEMTDVALGQEVLREDLGDAVHAFCLANLDDPDCEEADLRVSELSVVARPPWVLFGQAESITVRTVVENAGPDGPVEARVLRAVSVPAGLSVAPADAAEDELSLAIGAPVELDRVYSVECVVPGIHVLRFTSRIDPVRAATIDGDATNDERFLEAAVDCKIPVAIRVKPWGTPNPIQLRSAVVPVAILSTRAGEYGLPLAFDASSIDVSTLRFGSRREILEEDGGAGESHGRLHIEDVPESNGRTLDGDLDAVTHHAVMQSGLTIGDEEACVRGRANLEGAGGPVGFLGCDAVAVTEAPGPGR